MMAGLGCVVVPEGVGLDEGQLPDGFVGAVVSTSGSTGNPRSVMVSRSALVAAADACHERLGGPGSWANPLSPVHVGGFMTIVRAVRAGCPYICTDAGLESLPEAKGRSYLSVVPAQLHRGLEDPLTSAIMATYSAVLVGGQGLDPGVRRRAEECGIHIVETYGMSETCGGVVYDGIPLAGVVPFLVSRVGNDVQCGTPDGRIGLQTPTAFSGYVGLPNETAAVLRDDIVLTNDRGTWDGHVLRITGRVDDVVISGGVNVDLAELQRSLDEVFPLVAACFAIPDERWGMAIAVASTGPDLAGIRNGLSRRIEESAWPRHWMKLDELAYTESGKMDRRTLVALWEGGHGERA